MIAVGMTETETEKKVTYYVGKNTASESYFTFVAYLVEKDRQFVIPISKPDVEKKIKKSVLL